MGVHGAQSMVLVLLVMVAVFAVLAKRVNIPYPIVMVVGGSMLSLVPHVPRIPLNPDVVFTIFLPPLLYSAAWLTSWREFRANLVTLIMLAVGLVAFTVWGVAELAARFITALDFKSGFVLGAVVSTTDAIATTSIAKRVGLPKRVIDVLEGESLLNDATGLLALKFGVMMMVLGKTPTVGVGLLELLWLIAGGLGVGLLVGVVVAWYEQFVDDGPVEIVLSIVTPYAAYLSGEALGASGVLSVVAAGLFLSRKSGAFFSAQVRVQTMAVWRAMDFALNGLVFCLIGLQLPYVLAGIKGYSWTTLLLYGGTFSAVLILLRVAWMFPGARVAWWVRKRLLKQTETPPGPRTLLVVGWTGLRGVLSLAAAFALPETLADGTPFAQRNLIIFLAFALIVVTLVGQGLTLPWVIRALGLAGAKDETGLEVHKARKAALEAGLGWLSKARAVDSGGLGHFYDEVMDQYRRRLESMGVGGGRKTREHYSKLATLVEGAAREERRVLMAMREDGSIGDEALREVEAELDLSEIRLEKVKPK